MADTVEQLRRDIDNGQSRDKVAYADPTSNPLGSDDEAGGTPNTPERIALARRTELARSDSPAAETPDERGRPVSGNPLLSGERWVWWLFGALVLVAVVLALWMGMR